ncbi:MAG: hypothetical protein K2N23_02625 [Clostridia bacterium]|nr:hypothetical protein [Clostridia bacterium]
MKKRIVLVLLTAVIACFALFGLSACDSNVGQLQMDKKYFDSDYLDFTNGSEEYYIFHSDGTGEYRYYSPYYSYDNSLHSSSVDYTINFKYTYADEDKSAVVCFYDSVEYGSENGSAIVSTGWSGLLTVSKNVLCWGSSIIGFYINEDYLETIPNFAK